MFQRPHCRTLIHKKKGVMCGHILWKERREEKGEKRGKRRFRKNIIIMFSHSNDPLSPFFYKDIDINNIYKYI